MKSISTESAQDRQVYVRQEIERLGPWFHNLTLDGVQTAPNHFLGDFPSLKWERIKTVIPADLTGKSVLDIGCNAGFYSIEMKRRGAGRVVGIDSDPKYLEQARFAAGCSGLTIEFANLSVYEVAQLKEKFDLVFFMGVLYHLRHPLLALDLLAEHVVKDLMMFQSLMRGSMDTMEIASDYPFSETDVFNSDEYPVMHFVEKSYSQDPTNWWIPNRACAEAMLRSAGFTILARPDGDAFLCRINAERPSPDLPECSR